MFLVPIHALAVLSPFSLLTCMPLFLGEIDWEQFPHPGSVYLPFLKFLDLHSNYTVNINNS